MTNKELQSKLREFDDNLEIQLSVFIPYKDEGITTECDKVKQASPGRFGNYIILEGSLY